MIYRSVWAPSPLSIAFRPGLRSGVLAACTMLAAAVLATVIWSSWECSVITVEVSREEGKSVHCVRRVVDGDHVTSFDLPCQGQGPAYGDWLAAKMPLRSFFAYHVHRINDLVAGRDTGEASLPMNAMERAIVGFPSFLLACIALAAALVAAERFRALESLTFEPARAELTSTTRLLLRRRLPRVFSTSEAVDLTLTPRPLGWCDLVLIDRRGKRRTVAQIPESAATIAPLLEPLRARLREQADQSGPG